MQNKLVKQLTRDESNFILSAEILEASSTFPGGWFQNGITLMPKEWRQHWEFSLICKLLYENLKNLDTEKVWRNPFWWGIRYARIKSPTRQQRDIVNISSFPSLSSLFCVISHRSFSTWQDEMTKLAHSTSSLDGLAPRTAIFMIVWSGKYLLLISRLLINN